ncbi:neuronal acetylcholine receptor subunit alpha-6-like isoform X2 [Biomphalaria glabrata]|uniref:Neuronal acetylcholine receptor subunit alpha-6-like isoform X2 n=1 Tax=Biomphalaria glabrata TaxID=6526 RepID=A0A9W3B712_BIOGL|nr:neuronal acetylcholine receptor subunit alpha-6-like isoform X2 [Biomphalaria glabrata]
MCKKVEYGIVAMVMCLEFWCLIEGQNYSHTLSLFNDKLGSDKYDTQIRPLLNQADILNVYVSFELVSIVEIDDVAQSFVANGFLMFSWTDEIVAMTLDVTEMQFVAFTSEVQKNFFIPNGEWNLLSSNINITQVTSSNISLSTIQLIFALQRRPTFLIVNIVLPIVFLSFLNILVFVIPADSGEKIGYGITVLLALSVFMSTVSGMLPSSSLKMAKLTIYILILLIISMLTVIVSIIIVFLASMEEKETRHRKARDNLQTAVAKVSTFRRAMNAVSKLTTKVDALDASVKPSDVRMTSETNTKDSSLLPQDTEPIQPTVNKYKLVGKHIDKISFIVFLTIWVVVTLGFLIDIAE